MIENSFDRRDFLKVLGWGGAAAALSGCGHTSIEDGVETVVSYVEPPEYAIPGISVYFNTTCAQCDAGCNIMGRLREGRVLKLEGNANSVINHGKMCGLGQAGVQAHYNPDRVREPLLRNGDKGEVITWEKALGIINEKLTGVKGDEVAFMTGVTSGHTKVLLNNYLEAMGSKNHYAYEAVAPSVVRAANKKAYGVEMPRLRLDKAKVVVSFGADFLGAWVSPVNFSQQYAKFRKAGNGGRGVLVQIESKMTLTGANADRWLVIRPGTEGILALGIVNALGAAGLSLPADIAAVSKAYDAERVNKDTGVSVDQINKLAALLKERSPSLVIAGSAAEGYAHGSQNAEAISLLNRVLGNIGKTIEAPANIPFPQVAVTTGNRSSVQALNDSMANGKVKVLFSFGTNPVFTAPSALKFKENLAKVPFKVVFAQYLDETAQEADLVLPLDSAMEDWGTSVPEYMGEASQLNITQPMMEKLHPNTRGLGDILLTLLKQRREKEYKDFDDFYSYMRSAVVKNKSAFGGAGQDDDFFWTATLSSGLVNFASASASLSAKSSAAGLVLPPPADEDSAYPLHLIPQVTASMRDGRHANQPWLQESPDPLTTIVWDTWVELHPKTAAKFGIVEGDILEVTSRSGSIKAQAYLFPGIHPDAISVPFGNGHIALGRWAKGVGANAFGILDQVVDKDTGELAINETRVKISKTGRRVIVVKDEGFVGGSQAGVKVAVRASTDEVELSGEV